MFFGVYNSFFHLESLLEQLLHKRITFNRGTTQSIKSSRYVTVITKVSTRL